MKAADLLGPSGPLPAALPGYESRPGQLDMARAVEATLAKDGVLLCEAGTGTGKTLAYLVPAVLSGKKVVISTATRALQEQIVRSDLPLLREQLGLKTRVAVMKGLSNYLCRRRYQEFRKSSEALRPRYAEGLNLIESWIQETETGDVAELVGLEENAPILRHVSSSSETRVGPTCPHFDECFVTRMKREAHEARLVVVNHHLFFADLALRGPHPGSVLPDYDAVIFDEAHQLEDIATLFFGTSISTSRVEKLFNDAQRQLRFAGLDLPLLGGDGARLVESARGAAETLFAELALRGEAEGRALLERDVWVGALEEAYHRFDTTLAALGGYAENATGKVQADSRGKLEHLAARVLQLQQELARVVDGEAGSIVWLERVPRGLKLGASPVDVSQVFRERVFESVPAVVLTSATLTVGPSTSDATKSTEARDIEHSRFGFLRTRLGLDDDGVEVTEALVPSPFDFAHASLLYTPDDLPEPRDPRFAHAVVERVSALVELSGGGAFVLTTSLRSMRAIHRGLETRVGGRRLLRQGEAPKSSLLGAFKAAGDAVLVATLGFWEGVDVPGSALRLVVLEKIPFPVPSDPLVRARSHAIDGRGGSSFLELHVPAAAITLKQGFGRLIRSTSDRGVVALLDPRLHRRGYAAKLLRALPPARRTRHLDDVELFFRSDD